MKKGKRLLRSFFGRDAKTVALDLLGKKILRKLDNGSKIEGIIIETEAYLGTKDKASHSFAGRRTKRNEAMYGKAGIIYVYFIYGMHWLMNFIVSKKGDPQAVLIRAVDTAYGPARVAKYFQINKEFYGEDLAKSKRIWVEDVGIKYTKNQIKKLPRVGIDYAEEWKDKKLRFLVKFKK